MLGEDIKWYIPPPSRCYTHHEPGCEVCYLAYFPLDLIRMRHYPELDGPPPHWYDEMMERRNG